MLLVSTVSAWGASARLPHPHYCVAERCIAAHYQRHIKEGTCLLKVLDANVKGREGG